MKSDLRSASYKVLISYFLIAALVVGAGYLLLREFRQLAIEEASASKGNEKLLRLGHVISKVYRVDNLSRAYVQNNNPEDFSGYEQQHNELLLHLDSLKTGIESRTQVVFLDSLENLLEQKLTNIVALQRIKNSSVSLAPVDEVLVSIRNLEDVKGKLLLENFIDNPEQLTEREKKIAQEYIDYLNENVPKDETNTFTAREVDSILTASKKALQQVKRANDRKVNSLLQKEKDLLANDLTISYNLNNLIIQLEADILAHRKELDKMRLDVQGRINEILTYTSLLGLLLTALFFALITRDFINSKKYHIDLVKAKRATERVLRSREQLMATVSHDLKSPLQTISGYSDLLQQQSTGEREKHYLQSIQDSAHFIQQLVRDLLDFSRLESGQLEWVDQTVNLAHVLQTTSEQIAANHADKPVELRLQFEAIKGRFFATDALRIQQLVANLVGNAFKFTPEGWVEVSASFSQGKLELTVTDTGIGISTEAQQTVFEEFTQADNSIERRYGGSGLGLAIVKKLVELRKGKIELTSTENVGSVFMVTLPMREVQANLSVTQSEDTTIPRIENMRILVVDDDAALLHLTKERLQKQGAQVMTAERMQLALGLLHAHPFDLVLTDIQMPEGDGFELVRAIKSDIALKRIPVLAITGREDLPEKIYLSKGFIAVLYKPYRGDELVRVLHQIRENKQVKLPKRAEVTPAAHDVLYDLSQLEQFFPDDPEAIHEVLATWSKGAQSDLATIESANQQQNWEVLAATAHRMLPMLRELRVHPQLIEAAKVLQNEASSLSAQQRLQLIDELKFKVEAIIDALKRNN